MGRWAANRWPGVPVTSPDSGCTPIISAFSWVRSENQKEKHHEPTCETIFAKCHMFSCKAPAVCLAPSNTVSVLVFVTVIQR